MSSIKQASLFAPSSKLLAMHTAASLTLHNETLQSHGQPLVSAGEFLTSSQLWFESFQNWQSEFLAVGSIVILSIFLRERGSPESKAVATAHAQTPN